jgi:hypothetical protein
MSVHREKTGIRSVFVEISETTIIGIAVFAVIFVTSVIMFLAWHY